MEEEDKSWGGGAPDDAPEYVRHRMEVWKATWERLEKERATMEVDAVPITVTLPDGSKKAGVKGSTSPMDIAREIAEGLAKNAVVALVDDAEWDMCRPLTGDCNLKICGFDTEVGKKVMWHSTAHMLGEAMEYKYKGELCIGPPIENGFYYDIHLGDGKVSEESFKELETKIEKIAKSKRTFQRMELTKDDARNMFSYNPFKLELIEKLEDTQTITAYRDGPFIDLCRGPHVPNSSAVKAVMIQKTSSAYWLGKAENASLQRVYGISFPTKVEMKDYKNFLAEAAKRDHRVIGRNQELFLFHPLSPGSCFFLPHGTRIYNTLVEFMRDQFWKRGYTEVSSPNVFDFQLWETSGHAKNYRENMFTFEVEHRDFGLKPMNCPGHCLIYGARTRSYRELPLRMAEFGILHRNELSGTLKGLTRVRKFVQDDAHIFCTHEQVGAEMVSYLEFMSFVYGIFGFSFKLELSTRPEKYMGEIEQWDLAEKELAAALKTFTGKECGDGWELNPGDGAFYGPKIDIKVFDALNRAHQCATVQLDFQLPSANVFDLSYRAGAPESAAPLQRPVIIHRAIYGSIERFFAIITEHYAGKWPLWLSPRQVVVVPVSEKYLNYAHKVESTLMQGKFYVDVDASDHKLAKKVREAQLAQYNFILVVGEKEEADGTVNVRTRENTVQGEKTVEAFKEELEELRRNFK